MTDPIVIWGAGAIGGTVGAFLARAGVPVLMVDADAAHVAAINANGIRITGPIAEFTQKAPAMTPDAVRSRYSRVLLAVKGHHSVAAAEALAPSLMPDGVLLSLQNGLNLGAIAGEIGAGRVLLSLVNFAADVIEPGVIHYGGRGSVVVGEPDGRITQRVAALVGVLKLFDEAVEASDNVLGYLWGKLGYGAVLIATALTNERMADLLADPASRPALAAPACEVMAVAHAAGVTPVGVDGFDAGAFQSGDAARLAAAFDGMAEHYRHSAKERSGVWRDLAVRKRKTEVGELLGPVIALGRRHAVPTPALTSLVAMIVDLEGGRREFSHQNLSALVPGNSKA